MRTLLALGACALIPTGQPGPGAIGLLGLVWGWRWGPAPFRRVLLWSPLLAALSFAFGLAPEGTAALSLVLLAWHAADDSGWWGRSGALALSLLELLLALHSGPSELWLLPLAIAWLLALPAALRPEAPPYPLLGGAVLGLLPLLAEPGRQAEIGLSPELRLDGPARLEEGELAPALWLEDGGALTGTLYLRAWALDRFDGQRWSPGALARRQLPPPALDAGPGMAIEVEGAVAIGPDLIAAVDAPAEVDANGVVWFRGTPPPRYHIWTHPLEAPDPGQLRAERAALRSGMWTGLPEGLDPRLAGLAQSVVRGASEEERARAAERWLQDFGRYRPAAPSGVGLDQLHTFLFSEKSGHCELYATALALLLRQQGIPARLILGYRSAERRDPAGRRSALPAEAHAWVEARVDGRWLRLDPTPGDPPASPTGPLLALALIGGLAWTAHHLRGARAEARTEGSSGGDLEGLWQDALRHCARQGWAPPSHLPPRAAGRWLANEAGCTALSELAELLYRSRYGAEAAPDLIESGGRALAELRSGLLLRRLPQPP